MPRPIGLYLLLLASPALACAPDDRPDSDEGIDTNLDDEIDGTADATDEDADADGTSGIKLDFGSLGDEGNNVGDCGGGAMGEPEYEFSIIWIGNSGEGTVSKIDTVTALELARYRTGPGDNPDPSRTSVNLFGDVAIGNRTGSVVKIAADLDRCVDANQDGMITTSQGPADVLPWGSDECVLWYHEVGFDLGVDGSTGGPRAIAWDAGEPGPDGCPQNPKVWVGWRDQPNPSIILRRLDGETGAIDAEVGVPDWTCNWGHGTYGGATDKQRNFWGLSTLGTLVRVDGETLAVTRFDNPQAGRVVYGIALDADGNPWLGGWDGSLWKFDVATTAWLDRGVVGTSGRMRGLAIDGDGHAWIAGNEPCGLIRYDTLGATVNPLIELPGCVEPVGVSIDAAGFVWVVDRGASTAYKVDPDLEVVVETVGGLVMPYTYSDMTGAGLDLVVNPGIG
jgi:hypothetical protein